MAGFLAGLGAAAGGLFNSATQFGANYGSSLLNAKIQRSLRRTVYQDQMHSMRQAGLNPILAAGQSPGMGTSGTMAPVDVSSAMETGGKLAKTDDEKDLLKSQSTAAEAAADKALAEKETAEARRDYEVGLLRAQARDLGASAGLKEADLPFRKPFNELTNEFLAERTRGVKADIDVKGTQSALNTQALESNLPSKQAEALAAQAGASGAAASASRASASLSGAKQSLEEAREANQLSRNEMDALVAEFAREHPDLIKRGMMFDEIAERAGPLFQLFIKSKRQAGDIRDRETSAYQREQTHNRGKNYRGHGNYRTN